MLSEFSAAHHGVLFFSVELRCRYTLHDHVVSGAYFLTECLECDLSIVDQWQYYECVDDLVKFDAPTLWCSICAVCANAGYTMCFDSTLVY